MRFPWPFRTEAKSLGDPDAALLAALGVSTSAAGVSVSAAAALSVPAVQSAVRVISESAASLTARVVEIGQDGTETVDRTHPVNSLISVQANDWCSWFEFVRDLVSAAQVSDAGGLAYANRVDGRVVEIIAYQPGIIQPTLDASTGEPTYKIDSRPVPAANVIHLRGPFTRSPLTLAREAIGIAIILERHVATFFKNGARPSGVLETPKAIGDEGVKKLLTGWRAAQSGADNAGKTPLLWDGTTYRPLTMSSVDAELTALRKFAILEIARAFRVPPSMLFELDRATWSNGEQQGKEFLTYSLEPWLQALEGALRRALFLGDDRAKYAIRFERDDLTRADLNVRSTAYGKLVAARIINANEARAWEGLPPYEGGDDFANPHVGSNQPGAAAPQTDNDPADREADDAAA